MASETVTIPIASLRLMVSALPREAINELVVKLMVEALTPPVKP